LPIQVETLKRVLTAPKAGDPQSFDGFATSYERRDELCRGWVEDWLVEQLRGRSGGSAIDLGCGNGRSALLLAEHYDSVRAVDLSSDMIELARTRRPHPKVVYEVGDLDLETGPHDLVLSVMVLHHVPDIEATLARIAGMVAPGGTAILVDHAQASPAPQPRWRFHVNHALSLLGELRAGQRDAWERFVLRSDRRWVDHLVSDRFLTTARFEAVDRQALPGATLTVVRGLYTVVWHRPLAPPRT
jgi:ubiquinone/menaquinone biosynthesis C-methylase UbiE